MFVQSISQSVNQSISHSVIQSFNQKIKFQISNFQNPTLGKPPIDTLSLSLPVSTHSNSPTHTHLPTTSSSQILPSAIAQKISAVSIRNSSTPPPAFLIYNNFKSLPYEARGPKKRKEKVYRFQLKGTETPNTPTARENKGRRTYPFPIYRF